MQKKESPLSGLGAFIPETSLAAVIPYLQQHKVHLTITRERKSILGNYRSRLRDKNHRISVNGNLNKYSFLITLLHELAHLLAYEKFGHGILPHGAQWKNEFAKILSGFLAQKIFPEQIENILLTTLQNPAASSCADVHLTRALRQFDIHKEPFCFVEELSESAVFKTSDGRIFRKGKKRRKRFVCTELSTGKMYLFSPVHEVEPAQVN